MSGFRSEHWGITFGGGYGRDSYAAASGSAPVRAAWIAAVVLCVIAAFHGALVLGAPWGEITQGGRTSGVLPVSGRVVAAGSCVLSVVMAGAILIRVGQGPFRRLPPRVKGVLAWFTVVYAGMGVLLNLITRSTAERAVWAPVSILLLGLVTVVMVTTDRNRQTGGERAAEDLTAPVETSLRAARGRRR